jgi:hypothetical protein
MGFVWLSDEAVIISPGNINHLILAKERRCVFFEVGTEYLNVISMATRLADT